MSALVSSEERIGGACQITLMREEQPQLERGIRVPEPISAMERIDGWSRLAGLREHLREPEDARACTWILGRARIGWGVSPLRRRVRHRLGDGLIVDPGT